MHYLLVYQYITLIANVWREYNATFLRHCWFSFILWLLQLICKYEPFWQEVRRVESLILMWPLVYLKNSSISQGDSWCCTQDLFCWTICSVLLGYVVKDFIYFSEQYEIKLNKNGFPVDVERSDILNSLFTVRHVSFKFLFTIGFVGTFKSTIKLHTLCNTYVTVLTLCFTLTLCTKIILKNDEVKLYCEDCCKFLD